eukprot:9941430-Alexandrium_andersonii.AAC.1
MRAISQSTCPGGPESWVPSMALQPRPAAQGCGGCVERASGGITDPCDERNAGAVLEIARIALAPLAAPHAPRGRALPCRRRRAGH